jgi:uncharacterized protein (DUF4415 family)
MIFLRFSITVFLIVLSLCFSSDAWAGWIIDQIAYNVASSQGSANQKIESTSYFSKNKLKTIQGSSTIIINYDSDRILVSDGDRKLYWSGTIDEYIKGLQDSVAQAKARMEESLKSMPPEQRKAIEEEMRKQGRSLRGETRQPTEGVQVRIEETSDKQIIAGYRATKYRVHLDERAYQEVWISKDVNIYKDIDMKKVQDFQNRVNEALSSLYSDQSAGIERSLEYQRLFEKGYPLKLVHAIGQNKGIIEVVSAKEAEIPDREFEIPEGYRKTTLEEIIKMSSGGRRGR